jgi:hypothetical protein
MLLCFLEVLSIGINNLDYSFVLRNEIMSKRMKLLMDN